MAWTCRWHGLTGFLLASTRLGQTFPKSWVTVTAVIVPIVYFVHLLYFGVAQFSGRGFDEGFFLSLQAEAITVAWNQYTYYFIFFGAGLAALWTSLWLHSTQPIKLGRASSIAIALVSAAFMAKSYRTLPAWQLATATQNWMYPSEVEIPPALMARWSSSPLINVDLPSKQSLLAKPATPARNLILLYVESGGVMLKPASKYPGIAPNFQRLIEQYGFVPHIHASSYFTMEGLVNTQCGTLLPFEGGNDSMAGFGNRVYQMPCLGDVLNKAGYDQIYYSGTSRNFAGAGSFLEIHGYNKIVGQEDWAKRGIRQTPGTYGISDKVLFEQSIHELKRLSTSNRPYNLTMFTIGTHIPGFSYPGCQPYGNAGDRYLDAVHCTDQLVGQWVARLKKEGLLKNTVLVITGDHQVFSNEQMNLLFGIENTHDQHLPFIVIGDDLPTPVQTDGAGYDIAPTIVDLLAIESNVKFALGRSLLKPDRGRNYFFSRYGDVMDERTIPPHRGGSHCDNDKSQPRNPVSDDQQLSPCERAEIASLLAFQAQKYSRKTPRISCGRGDSMDIGIDRNGLHVSFSGDDVSQYFTHLGVPVETRASGVYTMAIDTDGSLLAQLYRRPDEDTRHTRELTTQSRGILVVIRHTERKAAKKSASAGHGNPATMVEDDGIWIYQLDSAAEPKLIRQAKLDQDFKMSSSDCSALISTPG